MEDLERLVSRWQVVDSHQAFVLLKDAFSIPNLSYILRASPAYQHVADLEEAFDSILRGALSAVTNIKMDNYFWRQASFPEGLGGLGVRVACDVALPAFFASLHLARDLVQAILSGFNMAESGDLAAAEESSVGRWPGLIAPTDVCSQKALDMPCALDVRDKMLAAADQVGRARFLAAAYRESGRWLGAVPVSSLGRGSLGTLGQK